MIREAGYGNGKTVQQEIQDCGRQAVDILPVLLGGENVKNKTMEPQDMRGALLAMMGQQGRTYRHWSQSWLNR